MLPQFIALPATNRPPISLFDGCRDNRAESALSPMPTLDWIGKAAVVNHHRKVGYHLLRCDRELSAGNADAGNLLVQGDNLLALKALLPYYAGKVKCIYIDPPYNTGNEKWVYNDNVNSPEIRQWLGKVVGPEAEDLSRHDKWLCMMYPRLALLRDFLSEDGAIFISIDDNEVQNLHAIMDEIFGRRCCLSVIVWKKRSSPDARDTIGNVHDYLLVYVRNPLLPKEAIGKIPLSQSRVAAYKNPDNDPRGPWASVDMTGMTGRATKEQYFTIKLPSGRTMKPPPGRSWGLAEATFLALRADNRIWFGKTGDRVPRIKKLLSEVEGQVVPSFWDMDDVGSNDEAKKEINALMGNADAFDTPKPLRLIRRVLEIGSDKDSLILDSFGGSGTTAHAVLAQNKADGGNRRFITVEMDEAICRDVTAQRVRKAIEGYGDTPGLGSGFRFCKLGTALFDEAGNIAGEVRFPDLAAHVFFTETGSPIPARASGGTPLLGVHQGKAVYLLFNGVLGDRRPGGGNVLTHHVAHSLPAHPAGRIQRVVYGEACRLGPKSLDHYGITFRQIPYELKVD
jgi:site-specific DNA-methyltransferase (adenine-specific)/adenine-specific DNA-methyltransferase